ncbi:metal-dependent hydrolase [Candidatus Woesearchaeota archaeon]|jgi:inner membrane protein|nr:metal-dependent hydrolase [Candidatus Woesearchaeota archaeon]MBT5739728.1 metal-dependent hydrolase [Candidatus Woesearchaeota archaeon]
MLFHTHVLLGIVFFLVFGKLLGGGSSVVFFLLVLLGSIFPDIDERRSKMNRYSGFIGLIIAFFFKHRGIFHSLIFAGVVSLILGYFWQANYAYGFLLGYVAHLVGDGITRMGIKPFYPFSKFKVRGPLKVGGFVEGLILLMLGIGIVVYFI